MSNWQRFMSWGERQFEGWPVWALKTFCAGCIAVNIAADYTLYRIITR